MGGIKSDVVFRLLLLVSKTWGNKVKKDYDDIANRRNIPHLDLYTKLSGGWDSNSLTIRRIIKRVGIRIKFYPAHYIMPSRKMRRICIRFD